jgi:integrase
MTIKPPRLLDQVRAALRRKHSSIRIEEAYVSWITRYIRFHQLRHPHDLGATEIEAFLTYLAVADQVAASAQNQALSALLFLYAEVPGQPIDAPLRAVCAKQPQRLPTVLTRDEVHGLLHAMTGVDQLPANVLYGSGLRLLECLRLRVKDIDMLQHQITVREGNRLVTVSPYHLVALSLYCCWISLATSPVQPVWWLAPSPAPLSP